MVEGKAETYRVGSQENLEETATLMDKRGSKYRNSVSYPSAGLLVLFCDFVSLTCLACFCLFILVMMFLLPTVLVFVPSVDQNPVTLSAAHCHSLPRTWWAEVFTPSS